MELPALLDRALRTTLGVVGTVPAGAWELPSPCTEWTVRQVGNHLVGMIGLTTRIVEGETLDANDTRPDALDQNKLADTDFLGDDPVGSLRAAGQRCVAAFGAPGVLERTFVARSPQTPGHVLATLSLMELLTHGWDLAGGAGAGYRPDDEVVSTVRAFAREFIGPEARALGLFGEPVAVGPDADTLTAHLGHLGRRAPWPGVAGRSAPAA